MFMFATLSNISIQLFNRYLPSPFVFFLYDDWLFNDILPPPNLAVGVRILATHNNLNLD